MKNIIIILFLSFTVFSYEWIEIITPPSNNTYNLQGHGYGQVGNINYVPGVKPEETNPSHFNYSSSIPNAITIDNVNTDSINAGLKNTEVETDSSRVIYISDTVRTYAAQQNSTVSFTDIANYLFLKGSYQK